MAFADCKTLEDFEKFFPARTLPPGAEVTRIAPSPTGMPHIGTAMQAVLHTAIASKSKGVFILRVEDTDQARTIPGAVDAIVDGLKWLNTIPNEGEGFGGAYGPYMQTNRLPLYKLAAQKLVDEGKAYPCFCTEERLDLVRRTQAAQHQSPGYDGHCRKIPDAAARVAAGEKHVIRFKMPKGEKITFTDEVRGAITFESDVLDDSVIMKSDGVPTYHLAAMVDDHFMRVTIVVRGEEWISSTPKHILLYRAFGWTPPKFLHTVLLRDKEKRKLSKRSGDTALTWFRRQGIMPEALCNFLYRIMWAHPEGKDVYPMSEFAEKLDLKGLPSTGPVADFDLLSFINGKYMHALSPSERKQAFIDYLDWMIAHDLTATSTLHQDQPSVETTKEEAVKLRAAIKEKPDYTDAVLAVAVQRATRFAELIFGCRFYYDYGYAAPASEKLAKEADKTITNKILRRFLELYTSDEQAAQIDVIMKGIAKELELKDRAVFMTVRLSMTGEERTPPLSEVAAILKINTVRARIEGVLANLAKGAAA